MKSTDLFTSSAANAGVSTAILYPDGSPTGETVTILSVDSDAFRTAAREAERNRGRIKDLPEDQQDAANLDNRNTMMASLVAGWSLEDECTKDNVKALFANAPDFLKLVDETASSRSWLFSKPSRS